VKLPPNPANFSPTAPGIDRPQEFDTVSMTTGLASARNGVKSAVRIVRTPGVPGNGAGVVIGPASISSLNVSLLADVNDDDGTLATSAAGIGFSNPAGVAMM
jgi:hypothetical protein